MRSFWLMALLIGVVAGLRSLTALACRLGAFLGWINLHSTWASWVANIITVVSSPFSRRSDRRQTPQDTGPPAAPAFTARIIMGAFSGGLSALLGLLTAPALVTARVSGT
jgi:uncharacterized membrane protein